MERNKVLDAIKYILIALVVIGHFIEPTKYTSVITCRLYCLIYSFHMPLFILISGYFYKHIDTLQEIKKCIPLIEILIWSHLGFLLIRNGVNISWGNIIDFGSDPAWYLLSLIYWRIGTSWLLNKFNPKQILIASISVDLFAFLLIKHGGWISIGRTLSFYPFFLIGYCLKDKLIIIIQRYKGLFIALGFLSIIFVLATSSVLQFQIEFQRANVFDLSKYTNLNTYQIFIFRYIILICSICISALVLILVNSSSLIQKLSIFGSNTLFIYYIQTFIFAIIGTMQLSLSQSLLIALISIPIFTYLSKCEGAKYMMNPICLLIHKYAN